MKEITLITGRLNPQETKNTVWWESSKGTPGKRVPGISKNLIMSHSKICRRTRDVIRFHLLILRTTYDTQRVHYRLFLTPSNQWNSTVVDGISSDVTNMTKFSRGLLPFFVFIRFWTRLTKQLSRFLLQEVRDTCTVTSHREENSKLSWVKGTELLHSSCKLKSRTPVDVWRWGKESTQTRRQESLVVKVTYVWHSVTDPFV